MSRLFRTAVTVAVALTAGAAATPARAYMRNRGSMPMVAGQQEGPVSANDINIIENLGDKVPRGLTFTDGQGNAVTLDSLLGRGRPVIVSLGYYQCPMLCNLVHEGLVKTINKGGPGGLKLGKDFFGLAVSIDPKEEAKSANTKQRQLLRALGHDQPADWPFVFDQSADTAAAKALAQAVGFRYKYDPESKQFAHAAVAFVLTPEGKISRYLYGVDFTPRDFRFALIEASGGRVGTSLDRVLLSCFKYDPMTQRYTPYLFAFVRIGAGLSCVALFTLLAVLWRKELIMRRRRTA